MNARFKPRKRLPQGDVQDGISSSCLDAFGAERLDQGVHLFGFSRNRFALVLTFVDLLKKLGSDSQPTYIGVPSYVLNAYQCCQGS